jgi:hypothetical protein
MDSIKYLRLQWDRAGAVIALVAAVIVLLVGYVGTARTEYIAEQIPYLISGGLVGMMLLTVAAVLWISADLRDEWRKLDRIERALAEGVLKWSDESTGGSSHRAKPASNSAAVDVTAEQAGLAHAASSREHA